MTVALLLVVVDLLKLLLGGLVREDEVDVAVAAHVYHVIVHVVVVLVVVGAVLVGAHLLFVTFSVLEGLLVLLVDGNLVLGVVGYLIKTAVLGDLLLH